MSDNMTIIIISRVSEPHVRPGQYQTTLPLLLGVPSKRSSHTSALGNRPLWKDPRKNLPGFTKAAKVRSLMCATCSALAGLLG